MEHRFLTIATTTFKSLLSQTSQYQYPYRHPTVSQLIPLQHHRYPITTLKSLPNLNSRSQPYHKYLHDNLNELRDESTKCIKQHMQPTTPPSKPPSLRKTQTHNAVTRPNTCQTLISSEFFYTNIKIHSPQAIYD